MHDWKTIQATLAAHGVNPRPCVSNGTWRAYSWPQGDRPPVQVSITRSRVYSELDVDWFGWYKDAPPDFTNWVETNIWPYSRRYTARRRWGGILPGGKTHVLTSVLTEEIIGLLNLLLPKVRTMVEHAPLQGPLLGETA